MSSSRRFPSAWFLSAGLAVFPCLASAQTAATPSTVVATQGGVSITLDDLDAFSRSIPEKERPGFFDSPQRLESLIGTLLLKKQLAAEARASGIDKEPGVQKQIELASDDALSKIRMQRFSAELKVPALDALAAEDYQAHKEKYAVKGKLDVRNVLISTKSHTDEDARALAETVLKEAQADPSKFGALVQKYSDDPGKTSNNGLIPEAGDSRYMPAFAKASKALKNPGDLSPVFKTSYGYHVIQLVNRTPDKQQSFADVREQILQRLRTEYVEKQSKDHSDQLRNNPMDANPDLVASLRTRYGSRGEVPAPDAPVAPGSGTP